MAQEKILIVDDDLEICNIIELYVKAERMIPIIAHDYKSAISFVSNEVIDLILLDIMLPDVDGYELCLDIRKISNTPIIFISSKGEEIDKILALSTGGDDYITKPFLPGELMARIKANIRRSRLMFDNTDAISIFEFKDICINMTSHEVHICNIPINLSTIEFDIFMLLARNPNRVFSPAQLFQQIWKEASLDCDSGTVAVHISRLRKKIKKDHPDRGYILTIKGVGYKFQN